MNDENKKTEEKVETIEELEFPESQSIEEVKKSKKRRKRKIILLTLAGVILLPIFITGMTILGTCVNKTTKEQIKTSYLEEFYNGNEQLISINDIDIIEYCGIYHGFYVVMLNSKDSVYTQSLWKENIGGLNIQYSNGNRLYVWKDGNFFTLTDAFEKGSINKFDLLRIIYFHKVNQFF